jgi:hypothetical protein
MFVIDFVIGKRLGSRNSVKPDESDVESVTGSTFDLVSNERRIHLCKWS